MIPLCPRAELRPGDVKVLVLADPARENVAVFCTEDDELYAVDDSCTLRRCGNHTGANASP